MHKKKLWLKLILIYDGIPMFIYLSILCSTSAFQSHTKSLFSAITISPSFFNPGGPGRRNLSDRTEKIPEPSSTQNPQNQASADRTKQYKDPPGGRCSPGPGRETPRWNWALNYACRSGREKPPEERYGTMVPWSGRSIVFLTRCGS